MAAVTVGRGPSYLPHRQFRKQADPVATTVNGYLPHRQFRKYNS